MKFSLINRSLALFFVIVAGSIVVLSSTEATPLNEIPPDTRCPVCGMFVAKYDVWITQIRYDESTVLSFDGMKDMMAFYHNPATYNGQDQVKISEIWVKDYYSLKWLDARQAFFVLGSDVHGPMGNELIPFTSKTAAESFLADHHGQRVLVFDEITVELVEQLRVGNRMKSMKK